MQRDDKPAADDEVSPDASTRSSEEAPREQGPVGDQDPGEEQGEAETSAYESLEEELRHAPKFPWELDDAIIEDEPLSAAERRRQAEEDRHLITHYGVLYSAMAITAAGLAEGLGIPGADVFLRGLAVGCMVATLNLHLLARAAWALLSGEDALRGALGFALSFVLLLVTAYWLVQNREAWLVGFGVGLALPAVVGVAYGVQISRRDAGKKRAQPPENSDEMS